MGEMESPVSGGVGECCEWGEMESPVSGGDGESCEWGRWRVL